jgi:3-oxoadipate enol-lactonase
MLNEVSADGTISFDDVGTGLPLVLLHAFPLSRAMWRLQREELQDRCRLITPDLPGFGGSAPFRGPPSVDQMADDVARLLDGLKIGQAVVGGLSMGGYVALAFARRHAGRLRGLVLADTRAEADDAAGKANRDRLIAFAAEHSARDVLEQMLPKLVGKRSAAEHPEVLDTVRLIADNQTSAAVIDALKAMRDRPDAVPVLATIAVPTLVVVGRDDELTPPARAEAMASSIRGARLVILDGAGHLSNLEQRIAFNQALRDFLAGASE